MEAVMKESWSSRWYWPLLLAIASMLGSMLVIVMIVDAVADHAPDPGSRTVWKVHLEAFENALTRSDLKGAELLWCKAYAAALKSRHWEGMVAAGDAYRRLGARAGFREVAVVKARQKIGRASCREREEAA